MAKHTERLPTLPHPPVSRAAKKYLSLHRPASELHKYVIMLTLNKYDITIANVK